jgi:hypothetical protein
MTPVQFQQRRLCMPRGCNLFLYDIFIPTGPAIFVAVQTADSSKAAQNTTDWASGGKESHKSKLFDNFRTTRLPQSLVILFTQLLPTIR